MDSLKLFAIILVIVGHAIQYFGAREYYDDPVYRVIYSFHMPLFMFISGYFAYGIKNMSLGRMLGRKSRQLLLPTATFALVVVVLFKVLKVPSDGYVSVFLSVLWFLKSLFVCCVLYYMGCRCGKYAVPVLLATVVLCRVIDVPWLMSQRWHLGLMYPMFMLGVLWRWMDKFLTRRHRVGVCVVTGLVFLVLLSGFDSRFWVESGLAVNEGIDHYNGTVDRQLRYIYTCVIGGCGTLFFVTLFWLLAQYVSVGRVGAKLCEWGQYTLGVYIIQTLVLELLLPLYLHVDTSNETLFYGVYVPLVSLSVLLLSVFVVTMIRRSGIGNWLFLGGQCKIF